MGIGQGLSLFYLGGGLGDRCPSGRARRPSHKASDQVAHRVPQINPLLPTQLHSIAAADLADR
jgi:hypothetical protein